MKKKAHFQALRKCVGALRADDAHHHRIITPIDSTLCPMSHSTIQCVPDCLHVIWNVDFGELQKMK